MPQYIHYRHLPRSSLESSVATSAGFIQTADGSILSSFISQQFNSGLLLRTERSFSVIGSHYILTMKTDPSFVSKKPLKRHVILETLFYRQSPEAKYRHPPT